MKFECEYRYSKPFGNPKHHWWVIGALGAIHFHVTDLGEEYANDGHERYSSGLETHYRQPPEYMSGDAPSHKDCWILGGPCWHDGTSLYAEEHWLPFWLVSPNDHERMFRGLEAEYKRQFGIEDGSTED